LARECLEKPLEQAASKTSSIVLGEPVERDKCTLTQ